MKTVYTVLIVIVVFLGLYFLPVESPRFNNAIHESLALTKWYAREHVILCLIPAFFIAGAITVFVSKMSVVKYFGAQTNKALSYGVASVSGTILAVCSCTILPLFLSIYKRGAGLGPAIAFLYSGPAINVLAIILTAKILGLELGLARAIGAVLFSVIIGFLMHVMFLREERERQETGDFDLNAAEESRPLHKTALFFFSIIAILVFANWGKPGGEEGFWWLVFSYKWWLTAFFGVSLGILLLKWFEKSELIEWARASWALALQILPLLLAGVLAAGFLLGRVGNEGVIPSDIVVSLLGGNSLFSCFFASVAGAFMYFATLTEVPIVQGLMGSGMGKGPALALLLAGPALSPPSMLVIKSAIGFKKTFIYVCLVIVFATLTGMVFGAIVQ